MFLLFIRNSRLVASLKVYLLIPENKIYQTLLLTEIFDKFSHEGTYSHASVIFTKFDAYVSSYNLQNTGLNFIRLAFCPTITLRYRIA